MSGDLTLKQLFGAEKSEATAAGFDTVLDAFAAALQSLESPPWTPAQVKAGLQAATAASPAASTR